MRESVAAENLKIMDVPSQDQFSNLGRVAPSSYVKLCRFGLVVAGLVSIAFAVIARGGSVTQNASASIFVPLAIGAAFIISGLAVGSRWQTAAFWFSVAMVGQAVSLQLVNAGYQLRYQHYKPLDELL